MSGVETAIIGGLLFAGTSLLSGYSAYQQGKAQAAAYDEQAALLARNARAKRMETAYNEDTARRNARLKLSTLRAGMSENNILDAPSSLGVLGTSATNAERDALNVRYQGDNAAIALLNQSASASAAADAAEEGGKQAFNMSFLSAGMSGLGGYLAAGGTFGAAKPPNNVFYTNASYIP